MTEVETFFKPEPIECPCGCKAIGQPRKRDWRDGSNCNRNCKGCKYCRGKRNRKNGAASQAKTATLLGIPRSSLRPGHEEHYGGACRFENKSGAFAGPVLTKFLASEKQSNDARSVGDNRPFVATFEHDGRVVAVFDLNDGPQVIAALAENWGMIP